MRGVSGEWGVEVVRDAAGLAALAPAWSALAGRCASATPFQLPEWLLPWWRSFAHGELLVLALRRGGELLALAPLLLEGERGPGRRVTLLGTGNSDHLDVLVDERAGNAARDALLAAVVERLAPEDRGDFEQLRDCSPLLGAAAPPGWRWERSVVDVCPALRLPAQEEELEAVVPRRLLANLRYARRRAERVGGLVVERATDDNLAPLLEALFALHGARWRERGLPGVLGDRTVRDFHRDVARGMLARGVLRLHALRVGGRVAAVHYGFHLGRRAYYYLGGFDPELAALSAGSLAVEQAVRDAIAEGAEAFDFLRGGEPYKYRWGAVDEPSHRLVLRARAATREAPAGAGAAA